MDKSKEIEAIEAKVEKGEELTPEEEKEIMSIPNDVPGDVSTVQDDEEDLFADVEDLDGEEDGEKTPGKKTDESKPKEPDSQKKEDEPVNKEKIDVELAKPEGEENLSELSDSERDSFWDKRRESQSRQLLEDENTRLKTPGTPIIKQPAEEADPKGPKQQIESDGDPLTEFLEGKDPEDFVSVEDLKALIPKLTGKKESPKQLENETNLNMYQRGYLAMCDKEASQTEGVKEDYAEVMACVDEIIVNGRYAELYQSKIAKALHSGKNPAIAMYSLVKSDPDFPEAVKKMRLANPNLSKGKPDTGVKKQEALIRENQKKTKTTAHHKSTISIEDNHDFTAQQIGNMSDEDYNAMPKKLRDYYHKKYAM